jgi:glycosyltransferase involved in cell wall biosynthesis
VRVLFVITSLGAGGTERSTALLLPHLRDLGVEATVVCLVHRDEGDERRVVEAGFDVRVLDARRFPGRVRALRGIIGELRPDVVHTAVFDADQVGRVAAAATDVPVLGSLVNTPYVAARLEDPNVDRWKLEAVRLVDTATARTLGTHFHAVTEGVALDAVRTLGLRRDRITVVERGRDPDALGRRTPERRARARASLALPDDAEVILAVGREEYQKGHSHLVDALALLAPTRPGAVVVVAGRAGNASASIDDAVRRRGLGDRVLRLGHRDDVADLLCAADVFALPSLYEGTAGAAIEALAMETPIVSSDLAGTRGVLVDGADARLVPVGDAAALARALGGVLDDRVAAGELADRGRKVFDERFTLSRSAERMAALYDSVASRGRRRR